MPPVVTIGLPFHNESAHLAGAIRSMLAQTFTDFELLLVDDGSTDDSLAVARSFADPRITLLSDGHRRHLPARLNEITRRAAGRLVARMDADDLSHPTRLEAELTLLDRDPRCDVVGTLTALITEEGESLGVAGSGPLPTDRASVLERGLLMHPTIVGRREWFVNNAYDEQLTRAEDRELWCRTVLTSRFAVIERCLHVKRAIPPSARFLASYLESHRQNRLIFVRYSGDAGGSLATARRWLTSYGKTLVMRGAVRLGVERRLVRRAGRPVRSDEQRLIDETLAFAQRP